MENLREVMVQTMTLGGFRTTVRSVGTEGEAVVMVHGLMITSYAFDMLMQRLPRQYRALAMDLRGHGDSECMEYDATRGLAIFAEDLNELMAEFSILKAHFIGFSLGGGVIMQFALLYPHKVLSLTLDATMSPFGLYGTKDKQGTPCWPDYAGSGSGFIHPAEISAFRSQDMSPENPFSQLNAWRQGVIKPPFTMPPDVETRMCQEAYKCGKSDDLFPGDRQPSPNWPGYRPGVKGLLNAVSPAYCNLGGLVDISPKPPILWIRGDSDCVVGDKVPGDCGSLGATGDILNWPGEEVYPAQPMLKQIRYVLKGYAKKGGVYREVVLPDCAHAPHIEKEAMFLAEIEGFFASIPK